MNRVATLAVFLSAGVLLAITVVQVQAQMPRVNIDLQGIKAKAKEISAGQGTSQTLGADIIVEGDNVEKTLECNNESVSILGNHCSVTIQGTCAEVKVLGNHANIVVTAASEVNVSGNHNKVSVNSCYRLTIMGNNNTVEWAHGFEGDPEINNIGTENTVDRIQGGE
jgi:hypothetical protein